MQNIYTWPDDPLLSNSSDLAGATDAEIAALPGGHTSKTVSGAFLTARGADRLVFRVDDRAGDSTAFAYVSEARLYADPIVVRNYAVTWRSPPTLRARYIVLSRTPSLPPEL